MGHINSQIREVQGLRGIAILLVLGFHLTDWPVFSFGFAGVDLFFVISGFVIFRRIKSEIEASGGFQIPAFVKRRGRRLLPAFAVFLIVAVSLSWWHISRSLFADTLAPTALSAAFGVANVFIARSVADYFSPAADENPLLHTWSLSIEEQFYLSVCIALWVIGGNRLYPRNTQSLTVDRLRWTATIGFVVSLALFALNATGGHPSFDSQFLGFFSPISRGWEFLAGALLALAPEKKEVKHLGAVYALLILTLALQLFQMNSNGITQVSTVLIGSLLLDEARTKRLSKKLSFLRARPLTFVGDISYSLYLYHWTLFVILGGLGWGPLSILFATTLASLASWFFLELPFLTKTWGTTREKKTGRLVVWISGFSVVLAGLFATKISPERPQDFYDDFFFLSISERYVTCESELLRGLSLSWNEFLRCFQSASGPIDVLVFGDSHAEHLFPGVAEEFWEENVGSFIVDETPVLGESQALEGLLTYLAGQPPKLVIVSFSWERREFSARSLNEILSAIESYAPVIVTTGTPVFENDVADCFYGSSSSKMGDPCFEESSRRPDLPVDSILIKDGGKSASFKIADTYTAACQAPNRTCAMLDDGVWLFRDTNHLTFEGSMRVVQSTELFQNISGSGRLIVEKLG